MSKANLYIGTTPIRNVSAGAFAEPSVAVKPITITENGTYPAPDGVDGYSPVVVQVDNEPVLQSKSVTPTTSAQTVTADAGYDALEHVQVEAIPSQYPDVSSDTVTADVLLKGYTSHDKDGNPITGTYEPVATEDLTAELNAQAEIITQLEAAIAGKAGSGGGGASVETCTVTITSGADNFGGVMGTVLYTTVENGVIVPKRIDGEMNSLSIECVCGSMLVVNETTSRMTDSFVGLEYLMDTAAKLFASTGIYPFIVTAAAGETATLTIGID